MKRTYFSVPLLVFVITLTACGSTTTQNDQFFPGSGAGQEQGSNNRPLSPQMLLAVGTFKLEGTSDAVDAVEASQLIPLWQLLGQLETSSSSAQQEVAATLDQIRNTMSPGQIKAITAMNLTNREAFAFLVQQGIIQSGGFGFSGTPNPNRTPRSGGGGGGFPGGGGGFPGGNANGQNLDPNQIATLQARRSQGGGFGDRLPSGVLEALVRLLQSRIASGLAPTQTVILTMTPAPASTPTPTETTSP